MMHQLAKKGREYKQNAITLKAKSCSPAFGPTDPALQVQQTIGNHGLLRRAGPVLQPKLLIGPANDKYEQEADRIADLVMRMPESVPLRRKPGFDGGAESEECETCESKPLTVQRVSNNETELSLAPPIVDEVLRAPGQSLNSETRAFMEPRFGYDFSQVRVHTDAKAAESARAVNAAAYTAGRDIVFGNGHYMPGAAVGKSLLAHELTHVVQQGSEGTSVFRRQERVAQNKCTKDLSHVCPPDRGPPAREIDEDNPSSGIPPLIYSYLEARQLGISEEKRAKRRSVGYAQQLLNEFLCKYDNWRAGKSGETYACSGGNTVRLDAIRSGLPQRLKVDCWFGDKTDRATRMFQLCSNVLEPDGKIGEDTWSWLLDLESRGARPTPPTQKPPTQKKVIDACYDFSEVTVVDKKTKTSQTCKAITSSSKPTPTGIYCVRYQGEAQDPDKPNKKTWYLLEPQFTTQRCRMQLHPGGRSAGCITVTDKTCFDKLADVLNLEKEEIWGVGYNGRPPGHTCCNRKLHPISCPSRPPLGVKCAAVLYVGSGTNACDFIKPTKT